MDKSRKEFNKIIDHSLEAQKKGYFIEAYVILWSIVEAFEAPLLIKFLSDYHKVKIPKDFIGRSTRTDIEVLYLLSHEEELRRQLLAQKKFRDNLYHTLAEPDGLGKNSFSAKKKEVDKHFKDLKKISISLIEYIDGRQLPKSILAHKESYSKGFEEFRIQIKKRLEDRFET